MKIIWGHAHLSRFWYNCTFLGFLSKFSMSTPVIIFSGTLFATNHVQLLLLTAKILHAQSELNSDSFVMDSPKLLVKPLLKFVCLSACIFYRLLTVSCMLSGSFSFLTIVNKWTANMVNLFSPSSSTPCLLGYFNLLLKKKKQISFFVSESY